MRLIEQPSSSRHSQRCSCVYHVHLQPFHVGPVAIIEEVQALLRDRCVSARAWHDFGGRPGNSARSYTRSRAASWRHDSGPQRRFGNGKQGHRSSAARQWRTERGTRVSNEPLTSNTGTVTSI